MKTEEEQRIAKIVRAEILDNLTIETKQRYDGWNGTVVEVELLYNGEIISETSFNVL